MITNSLSLSSVAPATSDTTTASLSNRSWAVSVSTRTSELSNALVTRTNLNPLFENVHAWSAFCFNNTSRSPAVLKMLACWPRVRLSCRAVLPSTVAPPAIEVSPLSRRTVNLSELTVKSPSKVRELYIFVSPETSMEIICKLRKLFVMSIKFPEVMTVPETSGKTIVLSVEGSMNRNDVSWSSIVAPSNDKVDDAFDTATAKPPSVPAPYVAPSMPLSAMVLLVVPATISTFPEYCGVPWTFTSVSKSPRVKPWVS